MEDQDKERAEFEETYHPKWRNGKPKIMADGEYNSLAFQCAWEGWQASAARSAARIAELAAVASKMADALRDVIREGDSEFFYFDEAKAALKEYEAMKGGA